MYLQKQYIAAYKAVFHISINIIYKTILSFVILKYSVMVIWRLIYVQIRNRDYILINVTVIYQVSWNLNEH